MVISSQNGNVNVNGVRAGDGELMVTSSFGTIRVREAAAGSITLSSDNGSLTAENLQVSGKLVLKTQFGSVDLSGFEAGLLEVESNNGGIDFQDGVVAEDVTANSGFQAVTIENVQAARYSVTSLNGGITLTGAGGRIELRTEFGDVEVREAENAALDLYTGNGKIRFSGSLDPYATQSLETNFGDIELAIPADSSYDIRIETQYGTIRSDLPVTLQGDLSEKKMSGTMNAGGPLLTIKSQNGNISIREAAVLEPGE